MMKMQSKKTHDMRAVGINIGILYLFSQLTSTLFILHLKLYISFSMHEGSTEAVFECYIQDQSKINSPRSLKTCKYIGL